MPIKCKEALDMLYDKYNAILLDHEMSMEQKIPYIIEWYTLSHEALIDSHIDKPFVKLLVSESRAFLRYGILFCNRSAAQCLKILYIRLTTHNFSGTQR